MSREPQSEIVNMLLVNMMRLDDNHKFMFYKKITQNMTDEERIKLIFIIAANRKE